MPYQRPLFHIKKHYNTAKASIGVALTYCIECTTLEEFFPNRRTPPPPKDLLYQGGAQREIGQRSVLHTIYCQTFFTTFASVIHTHALRTLSNPGSFSYFLHYLIPCPINLSYRNYVSKSLPTFLTTIEQGWH